MNGGCSIAMFDYRRIVAKEPTMKHSHYVVLAGYTTRLLVRVDMMYNQNKYTQKEHNCFEKKCICFNVYIKVCFVCAFENIQSQFKTIQPHLKVKGKEKKNTGEPETLFLLQIVHLNL